MQKTPSLFSLFCSWCLTRLGHSLLLLGYLGSPLPEKGIQFVKPLAPAFLGEKEIELAHRALHLHQIDQIEIHRVGGIEVGIERFGLGIEHIQNGHHPFAVTIQDQFVVAVAARAASRARSILAKDAPD